jgi:hypothetical protein
VARTSPAGDEVPLAAAVIDGLARTADWVPLVESVINDLVFAAIAVVFLWAFPERLERRTLLRLLHRLRSLAHVIDMHQLSKDREQLSPELHADAAEHCARPGRRAALPLPHLLIGNVEPDREGLGAVR